MKNLVKLYPWIPILGIFLTYKYIKESDVFWPNFFTYVGSAFVQAVSCALIIVLTAFLIK